MSNYFSEEKKKMLWLTFTFLSQLQLLCLLLPSASAFYRIICSQNPLICSAPVDTWIMELWNVVQHGYTLLFKLCCYASIGRATKWNKTWWGPWLRWCKFWCNVFFFSYSGSVQLLRSSTLHTLLPYGVVCNNAYSFIHSCSHTVKLKYNSHTLCIYITNMAQISMGWMHQRRLCVISRFLVAVQT